MGHRRSALRTHSIGLIKHPYIEPRVNANAGARFYDCPSRLRSPPRKHQDGETSGAGAFGAGDGRIRKAGRIELRESVGLGQVHAGEFSEKSRQITAREREGVTVGSG